MVRYLIVFAALVFGLVGKSAQATRITDIHVEEKAGVGGSETLITLDFDGPFDRPQLFALDAPKRWVLDIPGVNNSQKATISAAGSVNSIRLGQPKSGSTRVVIDIREAAIVSGTRTFDASDSTGKPRLVITLKAVDPVVYAQTMKRGKTTLPGASGAPSLKPAEADDTTDVGANFGTAAGPVTEPNDTAKLPVQKTPVKILSAQPPLAARPAQAKPVIIASLPPSEVVLLPPEQIPVAVDKPALSAKIRGRLPIVVIDAGHGGQDPGAPSVLAGRKEKEVTLAIARAIKAEIDEGGKARAMLTRSTDIFIPLTGRVEIARKLGADLFISIHADSIVDPAIRGATVYTLSTRASDKEAEKLAAKENKADIISGINLGGESPDVTNILIDLAQHETMNYSSEFAQTAVREVSKSVYFRSNFHRFAGFIVLKAPDVPSILLETGYMSNALDSKFLFSEEGQKTIGRGVARAVEHFFERRVAAN